MKELASDMQQTDPVRAPPSGIVDGSSSENPAPSTEAKHLRSDLARNIAQRYHELPSLKLPLSESCERAKLLMFLSSECSQSEGTVAEALDHLHGKDMDAQSLSSLRKAATPAYEELLEYILKQDTVQGMNFLVSLREDVLRARQWIRSSASNFERFPNMEDLDAYLLRLFSLWFSPGMLGEN